MRPVTITQTGAGQSNPVILDQYLTPFNLSLVTHVTGTVAYSVEFTYDDPFNPPAGGITWTALGAFPVASSTGLQTAIANDTIKAVRINQASGAGSTALSVNQAGAR